MPFLDKFSKISEFLENFFLNFRCLSRKLPEKTIFTTKSGQKHDFCTEKWQIFPKTDDCRRKYSIK